MGRLLFTLSVGVWLGTVLSFSYVFLPAIHAWAPDGGARDLLRQLFPRYYMVGIVCGILALTAVAIAAPTPGFGAGERALLAAPVAIALLCAMIGRQVLAPRLAALSSADQPQRFQGAHRSAAMLNTVALAMLLLALAAVSSLTTGNPSPPRADAVAGERGTP